MAETIMYPRFRWFVIASLIVITIGQGIIMISFAPLIGIIAKNLNVGVPLATGAFMGIWNLVAAASSFAAGFFCDRYGLVKTLFLTCMLLIIPSIFYPVVGNEFGWALAIRLIQSLSVGCVMAAAAPVAAFWFPQHQRGYVMGSTGVAIALGIAIGFVAAPALFGMTNSWQTTQLLLNIITVIGLIMALVIPFGTSPKVTSSKARSSNTGGDNHFRIALRQPATWIGALIVFCGSWTFTAFNDLTPGYLAIPSPVGLGFGPLTAGKFMTSLQFAFMVGSMAVGFVVQKILKGKSSLAILAGFLLFAVFAVSITGSAIYGNFPILAVCLFFTGFFLSWIMPTAFAFITIHYPAQITGKVLGMWFGTGLFGGSIGVLCGSLALHNTGNYNLSIIIVSIVAFLGSFLGFFLKPPAVFATERT